LSLFSVLLALLSFPSIQTRVASTCYPKLFGGLHPQEYIEGRLLVIVMLVWVNGVISQQFFDLPRFFSSTA